MMNIHKEGPKHQRTMKKKFHEGRQRHRRLVHGYKKKPGHQSDILTKQTFNEIVGQTKEQQDIIQFLQEKIFSVPEQSLVKAKNYAPHFHRRSNTDPKPFLFDYSTVSKIAFKEMLSTETMTDKNHIHSLVEALNNEETWTFIRQWTQLINQWNYLKLQEEQWAYYYQLGIRDGIWTGRVSKRMAREHSMCYSYGRSKHIVEQRCKKFQRQLQQTQNDIDKHITQTPIPLLDLTMTRQTVNDLVNAAQSPLRVELERRRAMLEFDARDHQCIHSFYDLKPTPAEVRIELYNLSSFSLPTHRSLQIRAAKFIWKATHDEQSLRFELAIFMNWLQYKSSMTTKCYPFSDLPLQKIKQILTKLILNHQPSTGLNQSSVGQSESTMAENSSYELIGQAVSIAQQRADLYASTAKDRSRQLGDQQNLREPFRCIHHILQAIEYRQQAMIQSAQTQLQLQIKLAFGLKKQSSTTKCNESPPINNTGPTYLRKQYLFILLNTHMT